MNMTIPQEIQAATQALVGETAQAISAETRLFGAEGVLDSMRLVELCLQLEDLATAHGFTFDWTSDTAMSRSRSMFRTVGSLTAEFVAQMEAPR